MINGKQNLPQNIGKPALRALNVAGLRTLEQVSRLSDKELLALHGVGPKAAGILRKVIKDNEQV